MYVKLDNGCFQLGIIVGLMLYGNNRNDGSLFFYFQLEDLSKTSTKVKNMFEIVFDIAKEREKREKAADNLVVLARERAGAELLEKEGAIPQIARLMKTRVS